MFVLVEYESNHVNDLSVTIACLYDQFKNIEIYIDLHGAYL